MAEVLIQPEMKLAIGQYLSLGAMASYSGSFILLQFMRKENERYFWAWSIRMGEEFRFTYNAAINPIYVLDGLVLRYKGIYVAPGGYL